MDSDDIFYGIKTWCHGVDPDINFNKPLFAINKIFHQFLMGTLELKPVYAANSVSVDGPIRVNNVDHHVRVTSEVIIPIQAVVPDPESRDSKVPRSFHEESLSLCGQQKHCREVCDDDDDDDDDDEDEVEEGVSEEIHEDEDENLEEEEDENEDEEECLEEDEEDEEDCDGDEEEDVEEVDDELCISITKRTRNEGPCRDPPQIKSQKSFPKKVQQHCRNINQTQEKGKREDGNNCKEKKEQNNKEKQKTQKKCIPEDKDVDELHQGCVDISKDELIAICKKYKRYDKKFPIKKTKSETVVVVGSTESRRTKDAIKQDKRQHDCKENEDVEEEIDESDKCLLDNDDDDDNDECQEEEEDDDDDDRYYGLERPSKAVSVVDAATEKVKKPSAEVTLRDYRCYDEKTNAEKNKNIFLKSSSKYSQITGDLDTYTKKTLGPESHGKNNKNSKPESQKFRQLSSSPNNNFTCNTEVVYYDENLKREISVKEKSEKSDEKIDSCKEVRIAKHDSFYFGRNYKNTIEVRNGNNSVKNDKSGKYYDQNCNNNNPIDIVEEKGNYYEHDDEGINVDDPGESNYADIRGSGDYTGCCFGKQEGDNDRENTKKFVHINKKVEEVAKNDGISSYSEIYHEDTKPSCTGEPAAEHSYHCDVKSQVKYQTFRTASASKSNDRYFNSSEQIPCESQQQHTSPKAISKEPKFSELLFQKIKKLETNYFSLGTEDIAQPLRVYNLTETPNESDMTISLTSFNFEQYKHMFESMKQRAFEDDFEDFFETRSPDINDNTLQTKTTTTEKPQTISQFPETDASINKKTDTKKGGLLKSIIGILTTSGTKLTQKAAKGNTKSDNQSVPQEASNKIKLTDKKYFSFGRYKVKSTNKYVNTENFIIAKKIKNKPKLRFGKTILPSRRNMLETTVNDIAGDVANNCSKCRIVNEVESAGNRCAETINNKVESREDVYLNAVTSIMETAKNSCHDIVKNIVESVDNISIDKVKSIMDSMNNAKTDTVKNIVESVDNISIDKVKTIMDSMNNAKTDTVKNIVESVNNISIDNVKTIMDSMNNTKTDAVKNMVESADNRMISKFLDRRDLDDDKLDNLKNNYIFKLINKNITAVSNENTSDRTSHTRDETQCKAVKNVATNVGVFSDNLLTGKSTSDPRSYMTEGSIFEESNKEICAKLNKQASHEMPLGVIFTAALEEVSRAELDNKRIMLLNSGDDQKHLKLLNENGKTNLLNTISEICEKIECSGSDSALTIDGYQSSFRPPSQTRDSNEIYSFQERDILNTLKSTCTNETMKQFNTTTMDANRVENDQTCLAVTDNKNSYSKMNPFYKVSKKNKLKGHEISKGPKLMSKAKENLKFMKSQREKQLKPNTKESTNIPKKHVFSYGKNIKSNTDLIKPSVVDSALKLTTSNITTSNITTSNITTSITVPYLTSSNLENENLFKPSILMNGYISPSLLTNNIARPGRIESDTYKYRSKSTGKGYFHEPDISGNINKQGNEVQNYTANSYRGNKSTHLEGRYVSPYVNIAVNENCCGSDNKGVSQFNRSGITDSFDKRSNASALKNLKIHKDTNNYHFNEKIDIKEKFKTPLKNKPFIQRVPEESKSINFGIKRETVKNFAQSFHDHENKNVNCGCDEDDHTSCGLQNVSNSFSNNQEPLQNICDIHDISAIPDVQTISSHEEAGSNISMGSFILDGTANSDIASNIISYEHPSLRNRTICRLEEINERLNPQSDMFVQNTQQGLSRNDNFNVETADNIIKSVSRDDEAIKDTQFKTIPFIESGVDKDKYRPYKMEDGNISLVQSYIDKNETPAQNQHLEHVGDKLYEGGKVLDSQASRCEELGEVIPVMQQVKDREDKDKRYFVKYSKYRNGDSSFAETDEMETIGRYAKYNIVEKTTTESPPDSQVLKYTNFGSMRPEHNNHNKMRSQDVQIFFGCPYTTSVSYAQSASKTPEAGREDLEERNVYTTRKMHSVNATDSTSNDYLENNESSHKNSGGMWGTDGYTHNGYDKTRGSHLENDVTYSGSRDGPRSSWKISGDFDKKKTEASKDTTFPSTIYSTAWKTSDTSKVNDGVSKKDQFWSNTFSSPLSKNERIWKMADAMLDRKVDEANDDDCWSERIFSPVSKNGPAWKMQNTILETKDGNSSEKRESLKNSPGQSGEKTRHIKETVNQKKGETLSDSGLLTSQLSSPKSGQGKRWPVGGLIFEKKVSDKKTENNLIKIAGNVETVTSFQGEGDHEAKPIPRNDFWRKGSDLVPTLIARPLVTAGEKHLKEKLQSKEEVNCKNNIHGDSLNVSSNVKNITDDKGKQKDRNDYNTGGGNSKINSKESASIRSQFMQSRKGILSNTKQENQERETNEQVNQIISPRFGKKIEARDKHESLIISLQNLPEHRKEKLNIAKHEILSKKKVETLSQKVKLNSPPRNTWNNVNDKVECVIAPATSKNVQEQHIDRPRKDKKNSKNKDKISGEKKRNKDNNTIDDKITEIGIERKEPISFKVNNKRESSGRQGYVIVPTFPQSVPEFTSDQISKRKHKNNNKDKTDFGNTNESNVSKEDKRRESGNRQEYVTISNKKSDKNEEQFMGNESHLRKEKASTDMQGRDLHKANYKDDVNSRQGYITIQNVDRKAVDHRVGFSPQGNEVNMKEKHEVGAFRESSPPKKSVVYESHDRKDYDKIPSGSRKKSSPVPEHQFTVNDSNNRTDMDDGIGDTSPKVNNQIGKIGLTNNLNFTIGESCQMLEKNYKEQESERIKENTKDETEKYYVGANETKATQNNGNISHIRRKIENISLGQTYTAKGNSNTRGKAVEEKEREMSLNKANVYHESKVRSGYSVNAEKTVDQTYLNEMKGFGNEKLARSSQVGTLSPVSVKKEIRSNQRNELIPNEGKQMLEYTLEETGMSKEINTKNNWSAEEKKEQKKENTSTENSKANKHECAIALSADKKAPDSKLHNQNVANGIINRVENKVIDAFSLDKEKTSPGIKGDALTRQNYFKTFVQINSPSNMEKQLIVSKETNSRAENVAAQAMYQGKESVSPNLTIKDDNKSKPNYLKSHNFDKNTPSHKLVKQNLNKENGGTTQKDANVAARNTRETSSFKTNKTDSKFRQEFPIVSNEGNVVLRQTHVQTNIPDDNGSRRNKVHDECYQRHEANSKINMRNDSNGKQTPNASKNMPHQQVVKAFTTKDSNQRTEKNVKEVIKNNDNVSPTFNVKGDFNDGPSYLKASFASKILQHQKTEETRVSGERTHMNNKTTMAAVVQRKEGTVPRESLKYDIKYKQSTSPNKNMLCYKSDQLISTEDSKTKHEKKEWSVGQVNKSMTPNPNNTLESKRKELSAFLAGLSISDHSMDHSYISRDEVDSSETMTGEVTMREKEFFLRNHSKVKHSSPYYKDDYMLDALPNRIPIEACSFENTFSEANFESNNGSKAPLNTDMKVTDLKPVQGYSWHPGQPRSKMSLSKANETTEIYQSEIERVDLNPGIINNFCEDYSVKCDHSMKASCSCFLDDSADASLQESHQSTSDVNTIKSKGANYCARSYLSSVEKTNEKMENTTYPETDTVQTAFEKKISETRIEGIEQSRKYENVSNYSEIMSVNERVKVVAATSYKQSVNAVNIKEKEQNVVTSKSDQFAQKNESNDRIEIISMETTKNNTAEVPKKQKPIRIFKIDYEENISDKNRYKATGNLKSQRIDVDESTDFVRNSRKIESKQTNHQTVNGDKEKYNKNAIERNKSKHIIQESETKVGDNLRRKAENSKSEVYTFKETNKKVNHSVDGEYKKLNHLQTKEAGKKWKNEIHRKRLKSETEKALDCNKLNSSSSVDEHHRNKHLIHLLHPEGGRHGEDSKRKHSDNMTSNTGEIKSDNKLRTIRENARQELLKKAISKVSPRLNAQLKNEPDASKKTVQKNETEGTQLTFSDKLKRKQRSAKKSLTETNQTDRYSASLIDSSLVDNVARAWMEDGKNVNNLKETRGFYPSFLNKPLPNTSTTVNNTFGARSGKEPRLQNSPVKKGDYLDQFPHPTFLHISKRKETEDLDLSNDYESKTRDHGKSSHLRSNKRNDVEAWNLGDITGGKLVTLNREVKKDVNSESSRISKSLYQNLQNLIPQTVSMNTRPCFNNMEGSNKASDFKKNMTKDDSFINHGLNYNDTVQTQRSRSGDKQTARYNKLDGVISEKSYFINGHKKISHISNYLFEDRSQMKIYREGVDKSHTTQEQKNNELKSDKPSHYTKSTTDINKGTRTTSKSTKIVTTIEAANGIKTTSENHKSKRNNSPRTKTTSKAVKVIESSNVNKIHSENHIARGQVFSYKVSSKGSRSEIVKSTAKGAQPEIKIENETQEFVKDIPKVQPILETVPENPKEVVNETKEILRAEPVQESAPLGLLARLFNSLTRSSKTPTVQATETIVKPEQASSAKPGECTKEQDKSDSALSSKEKLEGNKNKLLRNRSPYMSVREAKQLRPDYKQNVNSNADCDINREANPECVESWGDAFQKQENSEDRPKYKMNQSNLSKNLQRSLSDIKEWNVTLLSVMLMISIGTYWYFDKLKTCLQFPLPSVYELLYNRGIFSLSLHAFLFMKIAGKNVRSFGIKTLSNGVLYDFGSHIVTSVFSTSVYVAELIFTYFNGRFISVFYSAIINLARNLLRKTVDVFSSMMHPDDCSLVLDKSVDEIFPADLSQIRRSHSRLERGSLVFNLKLDPPSATYDVSYSKKS